MQANIKLGPVIGEVNFGEARILIEFDASTDVTLELQNKGSRQIEQTVSQANRMTLFVFKGIKRGEDYTVHYGGQQVGSFRTIQEDNKSDLNVAVVSCNSIDELKKMDQKTYLWNEMQKKVEKRAIDQVLHIGDQIYIDHDYWEGDKNNAFGSIEAMVKDVPVEKLGEYTEKAREIVREEYRKTWAVPSTKYVLANVSNRMILDDHEVLDDAGKDVELGDKNHWKRWYSYDISRYVYYEYQKRLVEDVDLNNMDGQTQEFFQYKLKNSGFFIIDNRGHYLWHNDQWKKENSYLGPKQKQALLDALKPDGMFKDMKSLFLVSSIPVILLTSRMMKAGMKATDDFNQHWAFDHEQELVDILDTLLEWKKAKEGRVVSLVSGDIHIGGHHDIYKDNVGAIKQLICSSIGQKHLPKYAEIVFEVATEIQEKLPKGWSFEKHDFCYTNNYGMLVVRDDALGHVVNLGLVCNDDKGNFKDLRPWDSRTFKKGGGKGCCNIF